jgi:hypothetical protein
MLGASGGSAPPGGEGYGVIEIPRRAVKAVSQTLPGCALGGMRWCWRRRRRSRRPDHRELTVTLGELVPSLRTSLRSRLEAGVWPDGAVLGVDGELYIGGTPMTTVAARFGTPACLASTYNLVGRPPLVAVAVADGDARLLVRRETEEDLLTRDIGL